MKLHVTRSQFKPYRPTGRRTMTTFFLLLVLAFLIVIPAGCQSASDSCGYNGCPASVPRRVNLHLVPHSHDDVGWLRTVDQYYYYSVQFILDNVVQELNMDPKRKFTYVEMAYFHRWWQEQNNSTRDQVRKLVYNGQLHFAQGGWCMNDEATTHYTDIVDQQTLGMRFLNDTFGDCGRPRVGWQIDPFGHSKEHAALLALMGLDAFYFARIHFLDQVDRVIKRRLQFVWRASQDLGSPKTDIFTGVFLAGYGYFPLGTNYEDGNLPVQDDPRLHDYNVAEAVRKFIAQIDLLRLTHRTSHLLLTMGGDFAYENARKNFKIFDKLIAAVNANTSQHNLTMYYSTADCYTKAVNDEGLAYSTKTDDFFPYASGPNSYWTGFYTSRPALKRMVRQASGHLQAVKQLAAVGPPVVADSWQRLDALRQAQGVAQHHDAVSGTEKQAVAYDYALRISNGIASSDPLWKSRLSQQQFGNLSLQTSLHTCQLINVSYCPESERASRRFYVTFYNPPSRSVGHWARLPVTGRYYRVLDETGALVASQTIPVNNGTLRIPERNSSVAANDLAFAVSSIPPLGYVVYSVEPCNASDAGASVFTPILLRVVDNLSADNVTVGLAYYIGVRGNASGEEFRPSGAYVFRPTTDRPQMLSARIQGQVIGPVLNETHWNYNSWAYLVARRYQGASYQETEATVGPLPLDDGIGREVVVVYQAGGLSSPVEEFLVDSNGRQLIRAARDPSRPEAAQFRPGNAILSVADGARQLTVLPDRAAAVSARPSEGQLSVMLHRVTLDDDGFGVGEALRERGSDGLGLVVKTSHWYFQTEPSSAADRFRLLARQRYRAPLIAFSSEQPRAGSNKWSALTAALPDCVEILTLEPWRHDDSSTRLLLRLEHIFQSNESSKNSAPVQVDLDAVFGTFNILEAVELNLSANQRLADQTRLKWRTMQMGEAATTATSSNHASSFTSPQGLVVTLRPMEIRTFDIRVAYKSEYDIDLL